MDLTEENSQRNELCEIIVELSKEKNDEGLKGVVSRLEKLYCGGFRHFYSDISSTLQKIKKSNIAGLETIEVNLDRIKENRSGELKRDKGDFVAKLDDDIRLEIFRMRVTSKISKRLLDNEGKTSALQRQIEQSQKNLQTKTDGIQKQFVAVLGIFASIIMVFSGGLSFTNATLSAIANANIFKLIAVSLTVGLVLIDVCHGLFYCLDHFMNSNDKSEKFKPLWKINVILLMFVFVFALCALRF